MRNRILIKITLWLLRKIDKSKIKYKNSWQHYISEIKNFENDMNSFDK